MKNDLPTIDIKGKEYVMVKDRILSFNATYPKGSIQTKIVSSLEDKRVVVHAVVYPDVENQMRFFSGHAQETIGAGHINTTSALENAETSAVGRALAMMGIGIIDSVASADEVHKAQNAAPVAASKPSFGTKVETGSMCAIHGVPYLKFEKNGSTWYSHKDGEKWCNKPKELPVEDDFPDYLPEEEL